MLLHTHVSARGAGIIDPARIKQIAEKVWLVTFMHYDLGFFDDESLRVECAPNPFEVKVSPMSPERTTAATILDLFL
jgi:hypothetical protein